VAARRSGRGSSVIRRGVRVLLMGSFCAATLGCAQQNTLYRWGSYEDSLYQNLVRRTEDPATQAVRLAADVARTEAEGKRVPPGVHAHLGWLLYSTGDSQGARTHLETEKNLFPESTKMVDVMLGRLGTPAAAPGAQALGPATPMPPKPAAEEGAAFQAEHPAANVGVEPPRPATTAVEPGGVAP
jgi:hypothetical protein